MSTLPRYQNSQITRRDFLKASFTTGGALLIGAFLDACAPVVETEAPTAAPIATQTSTPVPEPPFQPNLFIRIDTDGSVTLTVHRSEMGQGVRTALAMILADELEADWTKVRVVQSPADFKTGNQLTGGSGSVAINYQPLREVGAMARQMLVAAAAEFWAVSVLECRAEMGEVIHEPTGRRIDYGKLVPATRDVKLLSLPQLKDPQDFRFIGKSMPRVDEPDIVTGSAIYGLDVRLPGMLYTTLARCPVPGGSAVDYDAAQAESVPGVRTVVRVPAGVAVIAENTWAAIQGRAALNITWDEGDNAVYSSEYIHQQMADRINTAILEESAEGLTTIEAFYETPYLAHAALEPVNCVADVRSDICEIWAPTQNPQDAQRSVEDAIGLPTTVHVTLLGGGFGRRLEVDYATEAALISKVVGAPIQLVWTREDDIQHDFYRQPTYHWLRAGWDDTGELGLWRHYIDGPGLNGVLYREGRVILEEGLVAPYEIPNRISQAFLVNIPLPTGPWRAVMSAPNAFANEGFLDEVAAALERDPYDLRMQFLSENDRLRPVLEMAAEKANWGAELPEGRGRGIACHRYNGSSVAMVAEVSVQDTAVRVHKVVCAIDCGTVVHPDMVAQQMEGCIVFGLTSLFKREITFEGGRVQQSNFHDYPLLQMSEMPEIEVYTVPSTRAPSGTGEMGVPTIVPAVVNAIYNATGIRIRHMPIRPEDLQT